MPQAESGTRLVRSSDELREQLDPEFGSEVVLSVLCVIGYTVADGPGHEVSVNEANESAGIEQCFAVARSPETAARGHCLDLLRGRQWLEVVSSALDDERESFVRSVAVPHLQLRPAGRGHSIFEPAAMRTDVSWADARRGALDGVAGGVPHDGVIGRHDDGRLVVAVFGGAGILFGRSTRADAGAEAWLREIYPQEAVAWLKRLVEGRWGELEAWRARYGEPTVESYWRWLEGQGPL